MYAFAKPPGQTNSPTGSLAAGGRVARLSPQLHYDECEQLCVHCCFFRVFFSCVFYTIALYLLVLAGLLRRWR